MQCDSETASDRITQRDTAATIEEAVASRYSVRAFLKKPVPRKTIENILRIAGSAPSGSNIQPWMVYVLTGRTLRTVGAEMQRAYLLDAPGHARDYNYYTDQLFEPFLSRRRACGWGMYGTLGIKKDEKQRMKDQRAQNYVFFGAPVGLVFTIHRKLQLGSWIDYGMFMQNIMLACRGLGLHTCPQASIGEFPEILRHQLGITDDEIVLAGMSMGYRDPDALINKFRTGRAPLAEFVTFFE